MRSGGRQDEIRLHSTRRGPQTDASFHDGSGTGLSRWEETENDRNGEENSSASNRFSPVSSSSLGTPLSSSLNMR